MVCKCLDKSEAPGTHGKASLLCLVEAETTAKLLGRVTDEFHPWTLTKCTANFYTDGKTMAHWRRKGLLIFLLFGPF